MASSKENLKNLMKNSRTRVIILFTAGILGLAIVIALFKLGGGLMSESRTSLRGVPGIESAPGSLHQSPQYAALQNKQNVEQAEAALKKGTSAIPTIVDMQAFGEGVDTVGPQGGTGGVGFSTLAHLGDGEQKPMWLQDLDSRNCDKTSYEQAIEHSVQLSDLKQACSCKQLKDYGQKLSALLKVCDCGELRLLGYSALEMKTQGFSAEKLRICGYSACEEKAAGFSAAQMKNAGYADGELKGAGFDAKDLAAAGGIPAGLSADDIKKAGCSVEALKKLRDQGVSAAAIRRISGCSLDALKAAGFTADELKAAGFSPAELLANGFTPADLKKAGFTAGELHAAGLSPDDLAAAGFSAAQVKEALKQLPNHLSPAAIKDFGCDLEHLKTLRAAGVSAAAIRQHSACSEAALKAAGYSDEDLKNAGFSPEDIAEATLTGDDAIRAAACDPEKLAELRRKGVSAAKIIELNHCSLDALKAAGFTPKELLDAGFTPEQLAAAGFSPEAIAAALKNPLDSLAQGKKQGCTLEVAKQAKAQGMSAEELRTSLACSADVLKQAGFSPIDLKKAGFSPAELSKAGLSPADLLAAGFSPADLKAAGYDANALKAAGVPLKDLLDAGFSPADLANAGFGAKDLFKAGVAPEILKKLGFDAKALKDAGVDAEGLKKAGYSPAELTALGIQPESKADALASVVDLAAKTNPSSVVQAPGAGPSKNSASQSVAQLNNALEEQKKMQAQQKFQQKIQQKASALLAYSNQLIQSWKTVATQVAVQATAKPKDKDMTAQTALSRQSALTGTAAAPAASDDALAIKTGDILFAVVDTAVNSDEPGPILATIVTGALKGSKIIGSFNANQNSGKMTLTFTTLSVPGLAKTIGISAYAIDPNTGRTALSSSTNHHYVERYGALFASTFLEGFGNAFQSADTTITIGGNGASTNTTVENGINRSLTDNAVIALATLGKAWGQQAQKNMNIPTTIQIYSGTAIGVLFLQDITIAEK